MCMDANFGPRLGQLLTDLSTIVALVSSTERWVPPSARSVALRESLERLWEVYGEASDRISKELPETQVSGRGDAAVEHLPGAVDPVGERSVQHAGHLHPDAGKSEAGVRGRRGKLARRIGVR